MPPKFSIVTPKCSRCSETVYPMEQVEYDKKLYHNACFKCLECKSTLSLSRIACINNDLYCKTCFMKIFKKDGKYSNFTGAAAEARRATICGPVGSSPLSSPSPSSPSPSPSNDPTSPFSASSSSSSGSLLSVTPKSQRARTMTFIDAASINAMASSSGTRSPSPRVVDDTPESRELNQLFEAIQSRNVAKTKEAVLSSSSGLEILFKTNSKGQTPIEFAFSGFNNAKACGNAMLDLLSAQIATLRAASPLPSVSPLTVVDGSTAKSPTGSKSGTPAGGSPTPHLRTIVTSQE